MVCVCVFIRQKTIHVAINHASATHSDSEKTG